MQEQARANVSEVKSIAETEGNLAAARVVTEETKRAIASGSTLVAKTIANGSVTAAKSAVKTMTEAGTSAARRVANVVPGIKAYEESRGDNLRGLELRRRRMEERLRVLEDGGNEHSGRMNWWVGSMLRNNPTLKGGSEYFDRLREAARRYAENLEKLEERIETEKEKEE